MKFLFFLFLFLAFLVVASSVVYYPARLGLSPVAPPVTFADPGTSGVSVVLGPGGVSAAVTATVAHTIALQQDVMYSQTFDVASWPPTGWAQTSGSSWSISGLVYWIGRSATDTTTGGVPIRVAYYASSILSTGFSGNYYMAAYVQSDNLGNGRWAGVAFYSRSTGQFLGCAIGNGARLEIVSGTSGSISTLAGAAVSITINTWYMVVCVRNPATGSMSAYIYDTSTGSLIGSVSASGPSIGADTVAIFVARSGGGGQVTGYFDELVASTGNLLVITLSNVPSGWSARLYSGSTLLQSVTSTGRP